MPAVRGIVSAAERDANRMSAFILGVIRSAAFQSANVADTTAPAGAR
jgi:hypothetical protein